MRAFTTMILAAGAVGCTPDDEDDGTFTHDFVSQHGPTNTGPTDPNGTNPNDPDPGDPGDLPDGLNGAPPDQALPAPDFAEVVSRYGSPASPSDLVGKPTVLWFYPAAFTGG